MKILQCQLFYKSIFVYLQFTFSQIFVEFVIAKFSSLFLATSRPNISATKIFWPTILFVPLWSRNTAVWQHWRHAESRLWFCLFGLIPYVKVTQPRNYKLRQVNWSRCKHNSGKCVIAGRRTGILCSVVHLSAVRWHCKMRNHCQLNSKNSTILRQRDELYTKEYWVKTSSPVSPAVSSGFF